MKTIFKDPEVENNFEYSRNLQRLAYLESVEDREEKNDSGSSVLQFIIEVTYRKV